jgi:hypothetical protein
MKKLLFILMISICASAVAKENPFFRGTENQMGVYIGHSTGPGSLNKMIPFNGWTSEPLEMITFQYSQPMEFFRLPARQNIHGAVMWGHGIKNGYDTKADSQPLGGISWDVALFYWRKIYFGAGLGGFIRPDYLDSRQGSLFMFSEKLILGYHFKANTSIELFIQHMDAGGLVIPNGGFNFVGLSMLWNF